MAAEDGPLPGHTSCLAGEESNSWPPLPKRREHYEITAHIDGLQKHSVDLDCSQENPGQGESRKPPHPRPQKAKNIEESIKKC